MQWNVTQPYKRNGIVPFVATWMDIEIIILSEVNETEKTEYHMISLKVSKVAQLCPTLCDPMDCSLPGSSVHGFSRQEYWSGFPFPHLMWYLKKKKKEDTNELIYKIERPTDIENKHGFWQERKK